MNWLVLTLGVLLTGSAASVLLWKRAPRLGKTLAALLLVYALTVGIGTAICYEAPGIKELSSQYAVLLGAALEDGRPSEILLQRLELGLQYLQSANTVLIVSGGDPGGQGITEAEVMAQWLEDNGADMSRVLLESRAADTRENLIFSRQLAQAHGLDTYSVMILTSDTHQTRAQFLARQIGQEPNGLACRTEPVWTRLSHAVREVYAFASELAELALG